MGDMDETTPRIGDLASSWIHPAIIIGLAVYQFILTIFFTVLYERNPLGLLNFQKLRRKAFSRFWLQYVDMLSGPISEPIPSLLSSVSGTVLDVGPGSGTQLYTFKSSKATAFYGAEPETALHDDLRKNVKVNELDGKYNILTCAAEKDSLIPALAKEGVLQRGSSGGVFDYIVCLRVLCGVTNAQETLDGLYRLLKPGGTLIVAEHIKNPWPKKGGWMIPWALQKGYKMLGWSFWVGGCNIDRDTEKMLLRAPGSSDGWQKVHLRILEPWGSIPYLLGHLVKKS